MAIKLYFENIATGTRFEVLSQNADNTITMKSEYGTFTEAYSKARFRELGYKLVRLEAPEEAEADADE